MNLLAAGTENTMQEDQLGDPENPNQTDPILRQALAEAQTYRDETGRLERMSLYEQRMTRSLHRNRHALRELQAERRRRYERDRTEEILLARFQDLKDLPYQAPETPSPNGSVFSSEEITTAAERQRNLEAVMHLLSTKAPWVNRRHRRTPRPLRRTPLPPAARQPPAENRRRLPRIDCPAKYYHPEEFQKRRR